MNLKIESVFELKRDFFENDGKENLANTIEGFGKFLLLEKLAAGGMAEVYLAKSTGAAGISRFVAIKRILPQYSENAEFIEMFKEEAKIAVNLNHGNVVPIYEFGIQNSHFFLVLEYVEGQNLRQVLNHLKKNEKHFTIDQIVYIAKETAAGLDHAHRCIDGTTGKPLNIIHRDMSPQNVMVSFEGEIKIIDFGIAKAENQIENTRAGTIKGKFGYMSPEQADGQDVDTRTDIFSLGILLWELLANERLFTSNSESATLKKIRECVIPSLRSINPAVSPELERICNKALAKDKSLRYQSAAAMHKDLNRFLNTQYPEFSSQDFSVFMKSIFAQTYLENKKKLVEYSKLQGKDKVAAEVSGTITITESEKGESVKKADDQFDPPPDMKQFIDGKNMKVNLNDLKIDKSKPVGLPKKTIPKFEENRSQTKSKSNMQRTSNYQNTGTTKANQDNTWIYFILVGVMAFGIWYFVLRPSEINQEYSHDLPTPPVIDGVNDYASTNPSIVVAFESSPSGARVFIDGKDTGLITPVTKQVDSSKKLNVSFRREGFLPYSEDVSFMNSGQTLRAELKPAPVMGYVSIDSPNAGGNPVIAINGQRITERLPIKNYAIPANTAVKIQIQNNLAQIYAETTVKVGANQRTSISLILSNTNKNQGVNNAPAATNKSSTPSRSNASSQKSKAPAKKTNPTIKKAPASTTNRQTKSTNSKSKSQKKSK